MAATIARPSAGVPSASNTTTPSLVTTKPAFDMKPLLATLAMPASPSKNQPCGETCSGTSTMSAGAASANVVQSSAMTSTKGMRAGLILRTSATNPDSGC